MSAITVYRHPDGEGLIQFDAESCRLSLINDAEGLSAYALIGAWGLRDVAAKLLTLADADAERAGAALGSELMAELLVLRGSPQAEAFRAVHDKLYTLSNMEHADSATGGFAAAIVSVLEAGIANLPKFETE